ncbi:uncharacterized protein LOC131205673 [Anopheles bellator]|uniref:uncharacterized protein LOC131205673 n=1 Tax=Anopheles bellator TaxID=139047 RepID=UPI0026478D14|nr:uncharacterized protein LOC131205673 [Anopheles bellator]
MDGVAVPEYLDEVFLQKTLANGMALQSPKILDHSITRATANGDNYLSDVFRIVARFRDGTDGEEQTVSLIVKCLPSTGTRAPMLEELQVFEKEVTMFQRVVPRLSELMVNRERFAARCFYAPTVPERAIVFEDLVALGFRSANRQAGLDYEHCALVMRKIGQFHAASMRFAEQEADLLRDRFSYGIFRPTQTDTSADLGRMFENGLVSLIKVAKTRWLDFDQTIVAKLERLAPVYVDRLRQCVLQDCETDDGRGFRVLNHGDLWSNNMLFRYDPQTPSIVVDVMFVDLQLSVYSSPGVDLNYALANCPNYEARSRLDELIEVYYRSFSDTLRQLHYRLVPSLAQVRREIRRMEFFSLVCIVSILPIVLMDKTDELVADFDSLFDEQKSERAREIQYNGANYQRIVRPMLVEFNRRQLLD